MTLLHTALLCEGQILIEKYKLKKIKSPLKIYQNDDFLLLVSGIGKENTMNSLSFIFKNHPIHKAFNIGVAGCNDNGVKIGEIFCTNHSNLKEIPYRELLTVDTPQKEILKRQYLFDMEGKYFLEVVQKYLQDEDIYIFKVVSDHLDNLTLEKDFVKKLIQNRLKDLETYLFPIF